MAKRYILTSKRRKRILDAISQSGQHKDGYHAAGIGHTLFYKWLGEDKEFAEEVALAQDRFVVRTYKTDPGLHAAAARAMRKLIDGFTEEHKSITKTYNEDGSLVETKIKEAKWKRPPNQNTIRFLHEHTDGGLDDGVLRSVDFAYKPIADKCDDDPEIDGASDEFIDES